MKKNDQLKMKDLLEKKKKNPKAMETILPHKRN